MSALCSYVRTLVCRRELVPTVATNKEWRASSRAQCEKVRWTDKPTEWLPPGTHRQSSKHKASLSLHRFINCIELIDTILHIHISGREDHAVNN